MPTLTQPAPPSAPIPLRTRHPFPKESVRTSLVVAIALHAGLIGAGLGYAFVASASHPNWGDTESRAGSIQAQMVSSIPLPPKRFDPDHVLASESVSPAPTPPKLKAEPPPKPNEVLIPEKVTPKPAKIAEKAAPEPPKHPQPTPETPKAPTGETPGTRIPQSITQMKNGTASVTVDERTFGDRYAYYVQLIARKINQSKSEGDPDPAETRGKRAIIAFTINRDGVPVDPAIAVRSGSAALDTSTLRAIQRIDTFGPLPAGDHITIRFEYDSK